MWIKLRRGFVQRLSNTCSQLKASDFRKSPKPQQLSNPKLLSSADSVLTVAARSKLAAHSTKPRTDRSSPQIRHCHPTPESSHSHTPIKACPHLPPGSYSQTQNNRNQAAYVQNPHTRVHLNQIPIRPC